MDENSNFSQTPSPESDYKPQMEPIEKGFKKVPSDLIKKGALFFVGWNLSGFKKEGGELVGFGWLVDGWTLTLDALEFPESPATQRFGPGILRVQPLGCSAPSS